MSTDSVLAAYDPKGALRKALRESQERSASERAARAPRQAMPRDEAPATPLSKEEELFRDVVGGCPITRLVLTVSCSPSRGSRGGVPRARSEQRERGRGPAERCQTGGGHATVV